MKNQNNNLILNAIILIGELVNLKSNWGSSFDSEFKMTEGQFRSYTVKLNRLIVSYDFKFGVPYKLSINENVIFFKKEQYDFSSIIAVILRDKKFDKQLIEIIKSVANRGGKYSAKKFYSEIIDIIMNPELIFEKKKALNSIEALVQLETTDLSLLNKDIIADMLNIILKGDFNSSNKRIFEAALFMLSEIQDDDDPDIHLDVAFNVAEKFLENEVLYFATKLFDTVANIASKFGRLALEIASRIRIARILKMQDVKNSKEILRTLETIDDGSLFEATPNDREEFYCLQAYAHEINNEPDIAKELYEMAIMISEGESVPSINIAEAHEFIALQSRKNYRTDIAVREFLLASRIYLQYNKKDLYLKCRNEAAYCRSMWSKILISTSIYNLIEQRNDEANYIAWLAIKKLIQGIMTSDNESRSYEFITLAKESLDMITTILNEIDSDNKMVIKEITEELYNILNKKYNNDQENELLKFLISKVSTMIPLPSLVIMLIAHDGRLILGGEIGKEKWDESVFADDDLLSGALSAIMAILSEVISEESELRMVDAGQTSIMIEKSKYVIGALLVDRELNVLRKSLKKVVNYMDEKYPNLENWDGYSINFSDVKPYVEEIFENALSTIINIDDI